jgi:hypothetical protein
MPDERIPSVRISPDNETVLADLGLLADLGGTWEGHGFNLIARPDFEGNANLYLQLNQTNEVLKIDPIGSAIPNRGFGQEDISLYGLTYLQKISDAATGGALHIEPGIWITQPPTNYPPETSPVGTQLIARMGNIPHGNSLLAQGLAQQFTGSPTLQTATAQYNGSEFPSFNSTPFGAGGPLNAAGSSEALTAAALTPPKPPFSQYNISNAASVTNPRTPFGTTDPDLPASIDGVPMQTVVNDPITLLQAVVKQQVAAGYAFAGTALNIATQASITYFKNPNSPVPAATVAVTPANAAGGIENILFLQGGAPVGPQGPNADTALVYATFWIEKLTHPTHPPISQLQYAQMVVLDFEILGLLPTTVVDLGWPHISVATLRKTFN